MSGSTPVVKIYFTDVNCTGQPLLEPIRFAHDTSGIISSGSTNYLAKQAAYSKYKVQWIGGLTIDTNACAKSVDDDGLCNNLTSSSCAKRIKGELTTPEVVGLSATPPSGFNLVIKVN